MRNAENQCSFVRTNCHDFDDGLFSYLEFYYCDLERVKPVALAILIFWLSLLFSTIGIAASDFLCINLSTLASILGMSESLTGVTFLAFGNGSPDVFSTFAAMRSNSGSLAIGELIGAASFITSVVAGSMALIRPFTVARRSFVRDVGYFVVAVGFSMIVLADGRLNVWEASAMVALYVFYVIMVVTWHWYRVRRRRVYERNIAARTNFHIPENQELDIDEAPEDDEPDVAAESRNLLHPATTEDFDELERADVRPAWKEGEEDEEDDETRNRYLAGIRDNMHVSRPVGDRRRNTMNPIRPSLVGALEFQSVLSSLKKSKNIHHPSHFDNLRNYSDDPNALPSYQLDNRSVASLPNAGGSLSRQRHLSPPGAAWNSTRSRAVSANDAAALQFDVDLVVSGRTPRWTSEDNGISQTATEPAARSPQPTVNSPIPTPRLQPSDLLAPPQGIPSLRVDTDDLQHPPMGPSLRATSPANQDSEQGSPVAPFPSLPEVPSSNSSPSMQLLPAIAASPTELLHVHDGVVEEETGPPPRKWWPYGILPPLETLLSTLFPTLCDWAARGLSERFLGIIAAPSVFLLTMTVPVVEPVPVHDDTDPVTVLVTPTGDGGHAPIVRLPEESPELQANESALVAAASPNVAGAPLLDAGQIDSFASTAPPSPPRKEWNRWLVLLQLFLGPFFITVIGWTTLDPEMHPRNLFVPSMIALVVSVLCFTALILSTRHGRRSHLPHPWRPFLSFLGFVVAIAWIATIATEVVSVLKTLGIILNISDSLLGLTVFAVGNSLGDLVADVTVARLGYPVMALSACFGGPMLNILLGIGLGGLFMTWNSPKAEFTGRGAGGSSGSGSYTITLSKVLIVSGATLLTTLVALLVAVPLNKWKMDRKIGWGLVVLWCASTLGNVITELVS